MRQDRHASRSLSPMRSPAPMRSPTRGSLSSALLNSPVKPENVSAKGGGYKALLLIASLSMFVCYLLVSVIAPFFPQYAEERFGASNFMVGVAIAANPLISVIFSPIAGALCTFLGRGPVLFAGSWTLAAGTALFGLSESMAFCIVARMVQGVGAAMMIVSATALLIGGAPDLARALAIEELFVGVGFILGPALGGVLYDIGGFEATFVVLAILPAAFALSVPFALHAAGQPVFEKCSAARTACFAGKRASAGVRQPLVAADVTLSSGWSTIRRMATDRVVVVCCVTTLVGATVLGFLDPTLAQHVELTMNTSARVTGVVFALPAILYAAGVRAAPALVERYGYKVVMSAGFVLEAVSFVMLGPAPVLHGIFASRAATAFVTSAALLLLGLGVALMFIPALPAMKESLFRPGISAAERERMTDAISSAFNFANSGGEVLGPIFGSLAVQYLPRHREVTCLGSAERCDSGFVSACMLYSAVLCVCALASYVFVPHGGRRLRHSSLLPGTPPLSRGSSAPTPAGRFAGGHGRKSVNSPEEGENWETDSASSESMVSSGRIGAGGYQHGSSRSLGTVGDYMPLGGEDDGGEEGGENEYLVGIVEEDANYEAA